MKPFEFNRANPVQIGGPTIAPAQASMVTSATAQGTFAVADSYFNIASIYGGKAAGIANQYETVVHELRKNEAAKFDFVKFDGMAKMINNGADTETIKLLQFNEARRLDAIPSQEKAYLSTTSVKAQEELLYAMKEYQAQAGPNGEGYLENINKWFDDYTNQALKSAPSDISRADMLERMQTFRLQAIGDGINFEDKRRKENSLVSSSLAIESLAKQALMVPENFDAYLEQVDYLADNLAATGIDPSDIDKWKASSKEDISGAYMYRQIQDDPRNALSLLADPEGVISQMSPAKYISLVSQASNAFDSNLQAESKAVDQLQAVNRVALQLPLDPSDPAHKKVVNDYYEMVTQGLRDPHTGAFNQDPSQVADSLYSTMKQIKGVVPDKFASDFKNSVLYGSPAQVESFARLASRVKGDPKTAGLLNNLDKGAVHEALFIERSMSAGADLATAIEDARKQFRDQKPEIETVRSKQADQILTADYIESNLNGEFSSWLAPVVGMNEFFSGRGTIEGKRFWDPSNLGDATAEYTTAFKRSYEQFGDPDLADQYAKLQLHKTYASTVINGTNEVMQYAPEVIYPGRQEDFKTRLYETLGGQEGEKPQIEVDGEMYDFIIQPTDTYGVSHAKLNGSYPLFYVDKEGLKRPYLDKKGNQYMYKYNPGLTDEEGEVYSEVEGKRQALAAKIKDGTAYLDQIDLLIKNSPNYKTMTAQEKRLLKNQLSSVK